MKFTTLIALVGVASAYKRPCACNQPEPVEPTQPQPTGCMMRGGRGCGIAGASGLAGRGQSGLAGLLNAGARLPAATYGNDGYARLSTEGANSNTQISASQMTIPDKHTVTDQAKVSQAVSNGNTTEKNCQVA